MASKVWEKLLAPLKFGMNKQFHPIFYNGCNYLSMLGIMLIHVGKRGPCRPVSNYPASVNPLHAGFLWAHTNIYLSSDVSENVFLSAWRRHQMETFSALVAPCEGTPPVSSGFPSQRPVRRSFDLHLDKQWPKNWDACDLRHHRAHYNITVMNDVLDQ